MAEYVVAGARLKCSFGTVQVEQVIRECEQGIMKRALRWEIDKWEIAKKRISKYELIKGDL